MQISKLRERYQGKSLAKDLNRSITVAVSLFLIALMLLGYLTRIRDKKVEIKSKANVIAFNLRDSLELPLWNLNKNDVSKLVDTYMQNDFISAINVIDEDGTIFYEKLDKSRTKDLVVKVNMFFEKKNIGKVHVYFSNEELRDLRKLMLISALLLTLSTIFITSFVITQKVGKYLEAPIKDLMIGMDQIRKGQYSKKIARSKYQEFNAIVDEFNTLGAAIEKNLHRISELRLKEGQLQTELEIGGVLQQAMLPKEDPELAGQISWHYEACAAVAGDWLSFAMSNSGQYMLVAIGDVTGHGYAQSMITMAVMGKMWTINESVKNGTCPSPRAIAKNLNDLIFRMSSQSNLNMTASIILIDLFEKEIHYVNAGHPFPFLIEGIVSKKRTTTLNVQSSILGIDREPNLKQGLIKFTESSKLLIYTDGLTEAPDAEKKPFNRKFHRMLNSGLLGNKTTLEAVSSIKNSVKEHLANSTPQDDICFAVISLDQQVKVKKGA